ncbi:hypothetical protein O0882_04400 [Janthinobacterium sp. SUN073]|uniref:hypothetical protein n=1 Tax=Janthinobacterium sp. SUN073 TaxID=3004102 RepID=UPI0025B1B7E1|nr:hypothetical protein [Janthinobacterium sp. SUN073]MDN2695553.1 hypothetical protein [Janthinobacterium sp. SUN073]
MAFSLSLTGVSSLGRGGGGFLIGIKAMEHGAGAPLPCLRKVILRQNAAEQIQEKVGTCLKQ